MDREGSQLTSTANSHLKVSTSDIHDPGYGFLVELTHVLADWSSLEELLSGLMSLVLRVSDHSRVTIFLWDAESKTATAAASAGRRPVQVDREFRFDGLSRGLREAISESRTAVIDYDSLPPRAKRTADEMDSHLALFVPMQRRHQLVGALMVDDPGERRDFAAQDIEILESVAAHASTGVQNARLLKQLEASFEALVEKDRAIRQAYTDVIGAVTGGRLILLGRDELDAALVGESSETRDISDPSQLSDARQDLREVLGDLPGLDELQIAFTEGLANMLKHAGGGKWWALKDVERVQVVLSDCGPGIDFRHLPNATLVAGYSMAQSLGMGFTLMMELVDRIIVCTDPGGTTLVLEKDLPGDGGVYAVDRATSRAEQVGD
ncbi:MAG TPA: GAF domain-containing protein [Coriobacteriia bacterium]|nr:GAF domain-containing protein [Coriobacteriia bacterium]